MASFSLIKLPVRPSLWLFMMRSTISLPMARENAIQKPVINYNTKIMVMKMRTMVARNMTDERIP